MQYLINSKVILSQDGLRTPGTCEAEIRLTKVPLRLIYVLAENANTNISRSHIFNQVWELHGQEPSGSSLTVHLSNLRKQLGNFGIEHDAIKVLPSREVYFTATIESLPDEIKNNSVEHTVRNAAHLTSPHARPDFMKNSMSHAVPMGLKTKRLAIGITLFLISTVILFSLIKVFSSKNEAAYPLSYAGWEKAGEINTCNYFFLKHYLVRSFNVEDKIEKFIMRNNIKCVPSDMILVSVHDRNATDELRTEPERDFLAFCHRTDDGFACESDYYYNGK